MAGRLKAELKSLTGLRGLAAIWVMCGHFLNDVALPDLLRRTIDLLHRIARIHPLYALTTLICLALSLASVPVWRAPKTSVAAVLANLALLQSWGWRNESLNATGWSISTEWFANLLFSALALALLRWNLRRSLWVLGGTCAALILAALLAGQAGPDDPVTGAINWYSAPGALPRCTAGFMMGMACWPLRSVAACAACGSGAMMAALTLAFLAMCQSYALDLPLLLATAPIVIGLSQERSWLSQLMGAGPVRWLGTISFSIYLWQMPLATLEPALARTLTGWGVRPVEIIANLVLMAIILAVSDLSFRLIERPAQRALRAAFEPRKMALVL